MNKKNQKRSYVAPELTETICFVPEKFKKFTMRCEIYLQVPNTLD